MRAVERCVSAVRFRVVVVKEQIPDPAHLVVWCHGLVIGDAADSVDQDEQFGDAVPAWGRGGCGDAASQM
jgi:hypothetical protein